MAYHSGVQSVLGVLHVGGLRLQIGSEVQTESLATQKAEHDACVLVVFLVSGILAVLHVADVVQGVQPGNVAQIELFLCIVSAELGQQAVNAVHGAVAVREAVLQLVAQLQVQVLGDGLGIA